MENLLHKKVNPAGLSTEHVQTAFSSVGGLHDNKK